MLYGPTGVSIYNKSKATPGYTLFSPGEQAAGTFVIDMEGDIVHHWKHDAPPGNLFYLNENGNLFGSTRMLQGPPGLQAQGGHMKEIDWDGNVVWEHIDPNQHHDCRRRPNGNVVYLTWELLSKKSQRRVKGGRKGTEHKDGIYGDIVREITPDGETVWEWRVDKDMEIENYPLCPICTRREMAHANALVPLANGDVLISQRTNHLIARIGRKSKKFEWAMCDWILGHQHDVQPLSNGNVLVFANGNHAPWHGPAEGSRIFEIDPRRNNKIVWQYKGDPAHTFDSPYVSGVQRLWTGNTLICEGRWGRIFEVTPEGEIVWNYVSPYFVKDPDHHCYGTNLIFRAFRYADDSPQIGGRLPRIGARRRNARNAKTKSKPEARSARMR